MPHALPFDIKELSKRILKKTTPPDPHHPLAIEIKKLTGSFSMIPTFYNNYYSKYQQDALPVDLNKTEYCEQDAIDYIAQNTTTYYKLYYCHNDHLPGQDKKILYLLSLLAPTLDDLKKLRWKDLALLLNVHSHEIPQCLSDRGMTSDWFYSDEESDEEGNDDRHWDLYPTARERLIPFISQTILNLELQDLDQNIYNQVDPARSSAPATAVKDLQNKKPKIQNVSSLYDRVDNQFLEYLMQIPEIPLRGASSFTLMCNIIQKTSTYWYTIHKPANESNNKPIPAEDQKVLYMFSQLAPSIVDLSNQNKETLMKMLGERCCGKKCSSDWLNSYPTAAHRIVQLLRIVATQQLPFKPSTDLMKLILPQIQSNAPPQYQPQISQLIEDGGDIRGFYNDLQRPYMSDGTLQKEAWEKFYHNASANNHVGYILLKTTTYYDLIYSSRQKIEEGDLCILYVAALSAPSRMDNLNWTGLAQDLTKEKYFTKHPPTRLLHLVWEQNSIAAKSLWTYLKDFDSFTTSSSKLKPLPTLRVLIYDTLLEGISNTTLASQITQLIPTNNIHDFYVDQYFKHSGGWEENYRHMTSTPPVDSQVNQEDVSTDQAIGYILHFTSTYYYLIIQPLIYQVVRAPASAEQILCVASTLKPSIYDLYGLTWVELAATLRSQSDSAYPSIALDRLSVYLNTFTAPAMVLINFILLKYADRQPTFHDILSFFAHTTDCFNRRIVQQFSDPTWGLASDHLVEVVKRIQIKTTTNDEIFTQKKLLRQVREANTGGNDIFHYNKPLLTELLNITIPFSAINRTQTLPTIPSDAPIHRLCPDPPQLAKEKAIHASHITPFKLLWECIFACFLSYLHDILVRTIVLQCVVTLNQSFLRRGYKEHISYNHLSLTYYTPPNHLLTNLTTSLKTILPCNELDLSKHIQQICRTFTYPPNDLRHLFDPLEARAPSKEDVAQALANVQIRSGSNLPHLFRGLFPANVNTQEQYSPSHSPQYCQTTDTLTKNGKSSPYTELVYTINDYGVNLRPGHGRTNISLSDHFDLYNSGNVLLGNNLAYYETEPIQSLDKTCHAVLDGQKKIMDIQKQVNDNTLARVQKAVKSVTQNPRFTHLPIIWPHDHYTEPCYHTFNPKPESVPVLEAQLTSTTNNINVKTNANHNTHTTNSNANSNPTIIDLKTIIDHHNPQTNMLDHQPPLIQQRPVTHPQIHIPNIKMLPGSGSRFLSAEKYYDFKTGKFELDFDHYVYVLSSIIPHDATSVYTILSTTTSGKKEIRFFIPIYYHHDKA